MKRSRLAFLGLSLSFILSACALFPAYFQSYVNDIIFGTGWNHTDNYVSPTQIDTFTEKSFDLALSQNSDLLFAYIDKSNQQINPYVRWNGGRIQTLNGGDIMDFAYQMDLAFNPVNTHPTIIARQTPLNLYEYIDPTGWQYQRNYPDTSSFALVENDTTLSYVTITNSTLCSIVNIYGPGGAQDGSTGVASIVPIQANANPFSGNTFIDILVMEPPVMTFYNHKNSSTIDFNTNINDSVYYTSPLLKTVMISSTDNTFTNYNLLLANSGDVVLEMIYGNTPSFTTKDRVDIEAYPGLSQPIRSLSMDYDWDNKQLFFVIVDGVGTIHAYQYDTRGTASPVEISDGLTVTNVRLAKIKVRLGTAYLAFIDSTDHVQIWDYTL